MLLKPKSSRLKLPRKNFIVKPKPVRLRSPEDSDISFDENVHIIWNQILQEAKNLENSDDRELWMDALQTFANSGDLSMLVEATEWRRKVIPIDEFMFSGTYLGMEEEQTYPAVLEACHDLDTGDYIEAALMGSLGSGKTTIGNIMLARSLYKLSCMRHPQTSFGIQSKSSIVFTIQSVRFNTAKKAIFEELGQYINPSPYFKNVYPYDKYVTSQMIFREQNVTVLPVSSNTTGAISVNAIGGILDEMNFMQKITKSKSSNADRDGVFDQARQLYNTLARRRRSRFNQKGKLPGILFVISSSRYPTDFTELKAKESTMEGGTDPHIYVFRKSQWESRPRDAFLEEEFTVQVGNDRFRSKIIPEGQKADPNTRTIQVPMDFYNDFEKDIDGSLRDYAGVTTMATHPFILKRDSIYNCMELAKKYGYFPPFNSEQYDLSIGLPKPDRRKIRNDVKMFRHAHIDLGLTKDAAGICIGHIAGTKAIQRTDDNDKAVIDILPVIGIDVAMRVVPPPGGEIDFSQIRKLLIYLRDKFELDIQYVTFDGFQSVDSRQILRKRGFKTDYLSVEKIEPYRTLREALYDGRVLLPESNFLAKELAELEVSVYNNKEKVDHRPDGTKDVSDAVCGVVSFLMNRRAAWQGFGMRAIDGTQLFGDKRLVKKLQEAHESGDDSLEYVSSSGRPIVIRKKASRSSLRRKRKAG